MDRPAAPTAICQVTCGGGSGASAAAATAAAAEAPSMARALVVPPRRAGARLHTLRTPLDSEPRLLGRQVG